MTFAKIPTYFLLVLFTMLASICLASEIEDLSSQVKNDSFPKESLSTWRQVLAGEKYSELRNFAPHAILKIQGSRLQARLLAQTYFKNKDKEDLKANHDFRFAILNELVKTNMITVMDGWQKEVTASDYSYDERLSLNYLSRREGAMRNLYKESALIKSTSCEVNKKPWKVELRRKHNEGDKDYFWVVSGFHIYYTGIGVEGSSPENLPSCEGMNFFKLSRTIGGVFWEKSGGHVVAFEDRYFRPIAYLKLKDREEFVKISRKTGDRTCFVSEVLPQYPDIKKSWLCPNQN